MLKRECVRGRVCLSPQAQAGGMGGGHACGTSAGPSVLQETLTQQLVQQLFTCFKPAGRVETELRAKTSRIGQALHLQARFLTSAL